MESLKRIKSISIVSVGNLGASLIGFIIHILVAYYYGATKISDAFFMARSISETIFKFLFISQASEVFLPLFWEIYKTDKEKAWKFLSSIYITIFLVTLSLLTFSLFCGKSIVKFFAPGFSHETVILSTGVLPFWILFMVSFLGLQIVMVVFQNFGNFLIPSIVLLINPTIALMIFLIFKHCYGIYALACGYFIGEFLGFVILTIILIKKYEFRLSFTIEKGPIINYLRKLGTFLFSNSATFFSGFAYKISISLLPVGILSIIEYAHRLFIFVCNITFMPVSNVAFPELTKITKFENFANVIEKSVKVIGLMSLAVVVFTFVFGQRLIMFVFHRGNFTLENISLLTIAFGLYALSLFPDGVYTLLRKATLALKDISSVVKIGIIGETFQGLLFVILSWMLGYIGIILASFITTIVLTSIYYFYFFTYRKAVLYPINFLFPSQKVIGRKN